MKYFSILFFLIISFFIHAQIPSYVPTNGLKGWWPFCNNANDLTVNANNGTVYGATLTTDRFGNANSAYSFNGSSHIETTYAGVLGANKRAVSFWAKTSDATNPMTGVSWGKSESFPNTGKKFGCEFNVFSTGLTIDGADCAITYNTPSAHADNNWHHYVYQMDSASLLNQVQIFMDGVLVTSVATDFRGTSTMITLPNYNVWFGKMDNGLPYYFNGSLDDIAIWNRKLTQTEIMTLFNCTESCSSLTITPTPTVTPTATLSVLPLPNVLTPNNDGVNDYIDFTKHITEKDFDFEIFNRWGLSILKSNSNSKTIWDGTTTSGQPCVDGVYFYIIKTTDKSYKGNITLFR